MQEATAATKAELNLGLVESLKLYRKACLWSIFFSTCVVMEGFDMLLLNSLYAYPPFQHQFGIELEDGTFELTAAWQSGLSIGAFGGQIIGLFINGIIADRFGYRKTLIGALVGCCGFIFIIFFSETTVQLLIGELLIGVPWGVFQTITITYASEVCPTHLRAYLTTYVNLCWVIGQFIASGVLRAMLTRDDKWGYKIPFALQWIWPIPLMAGIWLAPESPWSLSRLTTRSSEIPFQPDETISMMIFTNEMEKKTEEGTTYLELFKSVNLRRTEIVCVTWMIQTFCGNTFSSYSTYFYEQAGLASESSFSMTLGQYALGAMGTFLSWFLMRQFGRRTLYLSGQVFMCILLFIIGCTSFAGHGNTAAQWTTGSMMLVYTFTYNSTVGPLCYSLVSELPSTRLRIKSTVVARNVYNVACIISNLITPRMINPTAWGWGTKSGFFWAGSCFLCAVWTYFRLPEPKGRTYAELDVLFEKRISARKFKTTYIEQFNTHEDGAEVFNYLAPIGTLGLQPNLSSS
ncbi:general substrate transporter [Aspergillus caelatus]|uniref:General substrate transporter n=1 Tax=Aspergillus caelatus TaxID=61420 RepID=A0A5N7A1N9_9EURO|nr:general substrate transporter [Aspergillus caelatus]KAE8363781.1 general substrate transporter [Aspergillus caelatus]